MSSTGVRRERSTDSRVADSILDGDRIQIENEKIFKETGDANTANSPGAANLVTAAGNFLSKAGDTRNGPMGNQLGIVEIIDDEINVSISSGNYFPVLVLNGEGGADDNLDRIVPGSGVFLNQEQMVQAGSFPITLRETGGGNILTPGMVDVILQPGDYAKLFFSIVAGNKWIVSWFSSNVGGGSDIPDGTIENQHLEWNNSTLLWEVKENLEFGSTGPFADVGFLRTANDVIFASGRTGADDGNIELKFTTQDELDLTNSNNSTVALLLRAQHAANPDNLFLFSQSPGIGGLANITAQNDLAINTNLGTTNVLFGITSALFNTDIHMAGLNDVKLDVDNDSGIGSTADNIVQIFTDGIIRAAFENSLITFGTPLAMNTNEIFLDADEDSGIKSDIDDKVRIFTNNTTRVSFESSLAAFTTDIVMQDKNIKAGGAGKGVINTGHIDFINNLTTPVAALSIYSDGTDLFAKTGGGVVNFSDIGGNSVFLDSIFRIQGSGDQTKQLAFEIDTFTTGNTRTFSWPDADGRVFVTPAQDELDLNTLDIFNIDQLTFMSTPGSIDILNVGFGALGNGGFRANILNNGEFQWTEENTLLMKLSETSSDTTLDLVGVLSAGINLSETTSSKVGTILQGSTTLQYTTTGIQHEFVVGVEPIVRITSNGIEMQGINTIQTPQIGFSTLGNIIEDNGSGMNYLTVPGNLHAFGDGTNTFATIDNDKIDIGQRYYQLFSIASPGVTGSNTQGRLFMDSGNSNHLSIIRNGGVIDLEDSGVDEFFGPWTGTHDAGNQILENLNKVQFNDASNNYFIQRTNSVLEISVKNAGIIQFIEGTAGTKLKGEYDGTSNLWKFFENISMESVNKITNVLNPTNPQDVVTKAYGDANYLDAGSPLTTKGDVFGFSSVDARVPVGVNGQVLTANSAVSLGVQWVTPSSPGIAFPIDFPITFLGLIGSITQIIDFSLSTRHGWKAEFNGDVELAFTNPPTGELGLATFKFKQDAVGDHTLTLPVGTINKEIVEAGFLLGIDEETGIVIEFFDDTFYAFLETGNIVSGGGSFSGNLSDLIINVNKDWAAQGISNLGALTGITGITGTGASVVISGIDTYDFFQAGQSIQNKADPDGGLLYNVNNLQSHIFRADTDEIARFEESAANIFGLNMLEHSIRDAKDLTFDVGATYAAPGSTPGIGYDILSAGLMINVPTGSHLAISENGVVGSTQIFDDSIESDLLTANSSLLVGILGGAPVVSGQFTNDGTDTFVFSGGAVRNLSNIGGNASQWSTFPALQLVDMDTNGFEKLTIAGFVDTGSAVRGSIAGDVTLGLVLSTVAGGKFTIQDGITPIATFDDTVGLEIEGTHVINMNKNIINTIGSTQWDRTTTFTPTAIDTIGFDTATMALKYNVALTTDIHSFQAAGELLASITRIGSNIGSLLMNGIGSVVQADILSATDKIITNNGFEIQNTDTETTTFTIPNNEVLRFTGGGAEVGRYDADDDTWIFNPPNDVQLSPDVDVDLTPVGDVVLNPVGEISVFSELAIKATQVISFADFAAVPVGSAVGAVQIKVDGVNRLIKFYST